MRRAFALAAQGPERGINPRVGCVILSPDGRTLAEGFHRGAGTAHAEVDALSRLAPGAASGATAVVSLEPCNHTGRTGPCAEALIAAGIARVVYTVADPGEASSGGAERLRAAGVEVAGGVLVADGEALLDDWLVAARLGRPVVTVKWASTLDGRAAAADGSSQWITGPEARADVHRERAAADAIIAGIGTVLADDPALTARTPDGRPLPRQPRPVVVGHRPVPDDAAVRRHPLPLTTLPGDDLAAELAGLHREGVRSVFVEGGPALASSIVRAGLADRLLVYLAPALLGGPRTALDALGVTSIDEAIRYRFTEVVPLGADLKITARPEGAR
ncbi:Diaminohydroxyphosphoribosylaminopyrimidine deaminase / 5-amino-6-(5-phosphoribosylamino)uracil reductase [Mycetocola reblochoni REB411]|uniref:Riboflavin biosynthesis protein RibD n=4 Tax=Mycetocola reblochoni TaxID=331618 RepID=A0A1R4JIL8_9MICO|nr:Diaminohydroxyphosphoribosylaminopyrimidine deaminase / 5-amino-6-(5-phosphoribosylamino)uracil reductase [Mycetocola reblochoni REB411]